MRFLRIFSRFFLFGFLFLLLVVLSSFWWVPALLPALLEKFDVEVAAVERVDDFRLLLKGLSFEGDAIRASCDRLEVPTPVIYLWDRFFGGWSDASMIVAGGSDVQIFRTEEPADPSGEPLDPVEVVDNIRDAMAKYGHWLPPVRAKSLALSVDSERVLLVSDFSLDAEWGFDARAVFDIWEEALEVSGDLKPRDPWAVEITAPSRDLRALFTVEVPEERMRLSFELARGNELLAGEAEFVVGEVVPVGARIVSKGISLNLREWGVTGLGDFDRVRIEDLSLEWSGGNYTGALMLSGEQNAERFRAPIPLELRVGFSGDLQSLRVENGRLDAGWATASLSAPVLIDLQDGSVREEAELNFHLDLAAQPFFEEATGTVGGVIVARPNDGGARLKFRASGNDLAYERYRIAEVLLAGELIGTELLIERLTLSPDEREEIGSLTLSGSADLAARRMDFEYVVDVDAGWVNQMTGQPLFNDRIFSEGRVSGPFEDPEIVGSLRSLAVEHPATEVIHVNGEYRASAAGEFEWAGTLLCNGAEVRAEFLGAVTPDAFLLELQSFSWADPERPRLVLAQPVVAKWRLEHDANDVRLSEQRLSVSPFLFFGEDTEMSGQFSSEAGMTLQFLNLSTSRLNRWLKSDVPDFNVERIALSVSRFRPFLAGSLAVQMRGQSVAGMPLWVDLSSRFEPGGVFFEKMTLLFAGDSILGGELRLPFRFQFPRQGEDFYEVIESGALNGALSGASTAGFARWMSETLGITLGKAELEMQVHGSIDAPEGMIDLNVASLGLGRENWPDIEKIRMSGSAGGGVISLEHFEFSVNQSGVSGGLALPLETLVAYFRDETRSTDRLLSAASGRIGLESWKVDNWMDWLPAMMRQSGVLDGYLALETGKRLSGRLEFKGFGLRPTVSLPAVDSIQGRVTLRDRRVTIERASANVGGNELQLSGWLDGTDLVDPHWEITAEGKNIPLVRTTDMILRSDLDLTAVYKGRERPVVAGVLTLQSSTLLVDFDPLSPNVESGPRAKPPYFTISDPSVADWRFDIEVSGDSFMRVRSPYFQADLSANASLAGTFSDPLLVGHVRTDESELRFPGMKMRISSGEAYIEPSRPDTVQLDVTATGQTASYVVTMEVRETLDDPQIQFHSSPSLSNAAIVRLLTTGSTTGGGAGALGLYLGKGLLGAGDGGGFSDRLSVDVGEERSRTGRSTVGVRYDLSEDWYLEGGYDAYDAYNLNLIWSIFKE